MLEKEGVVTATDKVGTGSVEKVVTEKVNKEVVYSESEMDAKIKKVRQDEKEKIYGDIERLKEEKKALLKKQQDDAKELEKMKQDLRNATDESITEHEVLAKESKKVFTEQNNKINELEDTLIAMKNAMDKKELDLFRQELLRANPEGIIEAMVKGNTKEEIKASLEKSKKEYKKIVTQVISNKTEERRKIPTVAPLNTLVDDSKSEDIKGLTDEEYAKKRASILNNLREKFQTQNRR